MTPVWFGLALWLLAVAVWRWQAASAVIDNAPTSVSPSVPAGVSAGEHGLSESGNRPGQATPTQK